MTLRARSSFGALAALATLLGASPAEARFRLDEIEPRSWRYNFDYYIQVLTYRPRLAYRWRWDDGWDNAAVGYSITAGSLTHDELYLESRAVARLPFGDHMSAEYRYVEFEDYDARYRMNEVELAVRLFRPAYAPPLSDTLGRTPPPDGLHLGGTGVLSAEKEFADMGFFLGYRGDVVFARVDVLKPDFFYNEQNKEHAEYTHEPYTLRARAGLNLLRGDLRLSGWIDEDLPLRLVLPRRNGGSSFRYRQLSGGLRVAWRAAHDLRFDLEASSERTRKRRHAPLDPDLRVDYELEREALQLFLYGEYDVAPLLGEGSSVARDTVVLGYLLHLLDERTEYPRQPGVRRDTVRRGESYLDLGYVLGIPSFSSEVGLGVKVTVAAGFLSIRDVNPTRHRVHQRGPVKLNVGLELSFRDGFSLGLLQVTFLVSEATLGGGNAQVQFTF